MWRRKLTPFLRDELKHRVYDPAEDEKKNLTDDEVSHFRQWKTTDADRFRRTVRKIIHFDLDLIENKADTSSSVRFFFRSEEHTSELQSLAYLVCRLLLEKK